MSRSSEWKTLICPVCNHDVTTNAPDQLLTKINSALATIRQEERRAVWDAVLKIANEHLQEPGFGYLLKNKLVEAAANENKEGK